MLLKEIHQLIQTLS